jgi:hypothetical protein
VEIAHKHPEAECESPRVGVEERFLLNRIALDATDIAPRYAQVTVAIEPYLAHADRAVGDGTFVPAGVASHAAVRYGLDELGRRLDRSSIEDVGEGGHDPLYDSGLTRNMCARPR